MEEIGLETSQEKRKISKGVLIGIIAVVSIIVLVVGLLIAGGEENSKKFDVINVEMTTEYSDYLGWDCKINGVVKNISNIDYDYVSIEFAIYDSNGVKIGSAYDNISGLASGESWSFSASSLGWYENKPVSYKITEITRW